MHRLYNTFAQLGVKSKSAAEIMEKVIRLLTSHRATVLESEIGIMKYKRFCIREMQSYGYLLSRGTQLTSRPKMSGYVCAV